MWRLLLPLAAAATEYSIYWDGVNPVPVPRHTHPGGWAAEFLQVFQPNPYILLNATHATIFSNRLFRSSFAGLNWAHGGESYSGIANLAMGPTPMSFFAGTGVAKVEKMHVLHRAPPTDRLPPPMARA